MAYYLLEYALIEDHLARRTAFREEHLALAREAQRRGELILAGALAEPADRAVLVWRTEDRERDRRVTHHFDARVARPGRRGALLRLPSACVRRDL
jgi:hypothetical protein